MRGVERNGCGPGPIQEMRVPGRAGNRCQRLKVPAMISEIVRRTVTRRLAPVCRRRFSRGDFKFEPKEKTRSTLERYRGGMSRNCMCMVSVSLRGFFSAMDRDGLVRMLSEAVGSNEIVSLVRGCLGTKIVTSKVFRHARMKVPRKKPLDPLLDGIVLGRLSGRLRHEKREFIQCTSSYVVLYGDGGDTREALEGVVPFVRKGLFLGMGEGGARMTRVDGIGCLNCAFCECGKGYELEMRTGSIIGVGGGVQRLASQGGKVDGGGQRGRCRRCIQK